MRLDDHALLLLVGRGLLGRSVNTNDQGMVTFVSFKGELLEGLDVLFTELGNLAGINGSSRSSRIDTVSLDGDDDMSTVLQELMSVQRDDTSLIGLGNVSKDDINHTDEHTVTLRHTGILDDGDDVGTLLGHVEQVTAHTMGELDGVDETGGTNPIGNVRNSSTSRGTEVENLHTGSDEDITDTTKDTSSQLGTERIPDTVLDLGTIRTVD